MSDKRFLVGSCVLALVLLSSWMPSGCRPTAEELPVVQVGIDIFPGFAPYYLGVEKGIFENEGISVDPVVITGTAERNSALASGRVQALCTTIDAFMIAASRGVKLTVVSTVDESLGADGIVATRDITTIRALRGKVVALQTGMPSHFFALYLLRENGIPIQEISIQPMNAPEAATAFISGNVDAAVTWEPWLTRAKNDPRGHVLATTADYPGILVDVVAVQKGFASANREAVRALLRGWFKSVDYWRNHKEESNEIMAEAMGMEVEEFVDLLGGLRLSDYETATDFLGTKSSPGPLYGIANSAGAIWKEAGVVEDPVAAEQVIDPLFLEGLFD